MKHALAQSPVTGARQRRREAPLLIDAPSVAVYEIEPLTREEARRILNVAAVKRNGARWSVALALGIRQGEALGLRWSYVDLETGVIRAWFQIQRAGWQHGCDHPRARGELWHRQPCKPKCKKHRHLPTCKPDCTRKGHVCFKRPCPSDCTAPADKCPHRVGGGAVFRQRKGKGQAHPPVPARAPDQAQVRDARVHDARPTAATLLIAQGVHIRVVQEVLGHTRVTTTERFTHVATLQMKDASERMDEAL